MTKIKSDSELLKERIDQLGKDNNPSNKPKLSLVNTDSEILSPTVATDSPVSSLPLLSERMITISLMIFMYILFFFNFLLVIML